MRCEQCKRRMALANRMDCRWCGNTYCLRCRFHACANHNDRVADGRARLERENPRVVAPKISRPFS